LVSVLVAGLVTAPGYEFMFLQMLVGLVVVFSKFDTRYWANFYSSILLIVFVYVLAFVGIQLVEESNLKNIDWTVLIWLMLNGFLTLLAYPLIPLLGTAFGFTSSITLAELSDLGHSLLKELSIKAPGTLQHSLQVANLAEAAAKEIEANDLLVKVGALYHDIGKTVTPPYFIENQSGIANPHDELPPLESARLILAHVTEGVKMAEKLGLPKVLIRFISTHHGTTFVEYFYRLHLTQNTEGVLDRPKFQYAGPKPRTREEAILMLADSLEAAAKSMKNPTMEGIDELVEKIVAGKTQQGQLDDSALTFNELARCKESFKKTLKSIHHVRIEYPK
jgi:cyclic-di-AMP phosphodiesterase PgpH